MSTSTAEQSQTKGQQSERTSAATSASGYDKDQVLHWYEQMLLVRRFEERAGMLYGQAKIEGFCHLYIGQEAVSSGVEAAMRNDDYMITAYRDHGQALVRGIPPETVMSELFGRVDGTVGGKGGSMHMFSKEHHMYGGHGIVGAQIPLGAGLAFAAKYRDDDNVCVTMFGDGAARQGALHETFNMAMLWNLPVVFIVENNYYAMGTSVERTSNVTDIYKLAQGYEMPAEKVDGMSVFEVYEAVSEAVTAAREGNGPTFLEIKTYRFKGHSMSDPAKYRTKDELGEYKDRDPIVQLKHYIMEHELATQDELDDIDKRMKARVKEAVEFAENSPHPDPQALYKHVYKEDDYPFVKDF